MCGMLGIDVSDNSCELSELDPDSLSEPDTLLAPPDDVDLSLLETESSSPEVLLSLVPIFTLAADWMGNGPVVSADCGVD